MQFVDGNGNVFLCISVHIFHFTVNRYNHQPECAPPSNTTVIIVGVIVAFLVLLFVAGAVLFWAKRSGKLQTGAHRTLTSFENPVYEYEQNINSNTPNPIDLKVEPIIEK